jgi:hypothetical protein
VTLTNAYDCTHAYTVYLKIDSCSLLLYLWIYFFVAALFRSKHCVGNPFFRLSVIRIQKPETRSSALLLSCNESETWNGNQPLYDKLASYLQRSERDNPKSYHC